LILNSNYLRGESLLIWLLSDYLTNTMKDEVN
jgi:hypothetical protein